MSLGPRVATQHVPGQAAARGMGHGCHPLGRPCCHPATSWPKGAPAMGCSGPSLCSRSFHSRSLVSHWSVSYIPWLAPSCSRELAINSSAALRQQTRVDVLLETVSFFLFWSPIYLHGAIFLITHIHDVAGLCRYLPYSMGVSLVYNVRVFQPCHTLLACPLGSQSHP